MIKIINICYDDYSNYSYENCQALRSVGVDCESFKLVKHMFGYANQSKVVTMAQMIEEIKKADLIQIMHSSVSLAKYVVDAKKRAVVYHTGSKYRNDHKILNPIFNGFCEVAFTDQCEFIGTGSFNECYIAMAIDIDKYKFSHYKKGDKKVFAHYPSNPDVKGTNHILEMLKLTNRDKYEFVYSKQKQAHRFNLERMSMCDVYVELFKPVLHGKPYGCYGVSAFEAAAMGRVVITNNVFADVYPAAYGTEPMLQVANTEEQFIKTIDSLAGCSQASIEILKKETFNWLRKYHSYQATGERIKKILSL